MIITKHAYKRAKERLGWKKQSLKRTAHIALRSGIRHNQLTGQINRYVSRLYLTHKNCNNIRIYGQNVFMFKNVTLITIFRVPNNLIKYLKKMKITLEIDTTKTEEIQEGLRVLSSLSGNAEFVPAKKPATRKTRATKPDPKPKEEKPVEKIEVKDEEVVEAKKITIDAVRELLSKKVGEHREDIKSKLGELGAANVTKLDVGKYEKFYTFLSELE